MAPMFGAAAMSMSSFCVVSNALRLNLFKVHDASRDKKLKNMVHPDKDGRLLPPAGEETENNDHSIQDIAENGGKGNAMTKTMNIEGMMCAHCEATVKKALENLSQVQSAEVSHEKNSAVVTLTEAVDDEVLKKAVEDKDYKVISIA